jgi:integrase
MANDVSVLPVKHPRYSYRVIYPGGDGGKRLQKYFKTETAAGVFANKQRKEAGRDGSAFKPLDDFDRAAVTFWRGFVASVPDSPPPALLAVLQEFASRWKSTHASVTVLQAVAAYEAAKDSEGLRAVSRQAIKTRCARFTKTFGERQISSISTAEISDWILGLEALRQRGGSASQGKGGKSPAPAQVGLLAKRNHRLAVSGLFAYAKTRGWVKDNPVTDAARPKPPKTRPGVLRPGEVARFFGALAEAGAAKHGTLVPFWAVRFFAGVREQEALRMDWSMVDLATSEIHLPDTVTKTGRSRTIKIKPALKAFLSPHKKPAGPLVTSSAMARRYYLARALAILAAEDKALEKVGEEVSAFPVPMPANAARHSFATFHLLAFRHAGETALQLGHGGSPEMLHRHYKGVASEAEARAFWAIRPAGAPANVISMKSPAATKANPRKAAR